jgi:dUTP pyrophosphatase
MKIKLIRFSDKLNIPQRAHYNDAGADVRALKSYFVRPTETIKVPLGFGLEIPDGFCGMIVTKSSKAKIGLISQIPPIDSGYRGEINALLTNTSNTPIVIEEGEKIAQLVIIPIVLAEFVEDLGPTRGQGAFGSTGKF